MPASSLLSLVQNSDLVVLLKKAMMSNYDYSVLNNIEKQGMLRDNEGRSSIRILHM